MMPIENATELEELQEAIEWLTTQPAELPNPHHAAVDAARAALMALREDYRKAGAAVDQADRVLREHERAASQWDTAQAPRVNAQAANTGHGHVRPRPDGLMARCGGPGICVACARELGAAEARKYGYPYVTRNPGPHG
jgi:hypothetical protein